MKRETKSVDELVELLTVYNRAYRQGAPMVADDEYDALVEQLRTMAPDHPFLQQVEPEVLADRRQVRHPFPMLSIEKAYRREQLERFVARVEKEAKVLDLAAVAYRLTPKLDGLAGRDDGRVFATRGNGLVGYEISRAFDKGVVAIGGRGQGMGEIVVVKSYFERHLRGYFEHPRNMVVGIISSELLNANARQALADQQVHFVPYSQVNQVIVDGRRLVEETADLVETVLSDVDYPTDGVVAEVVDDRLKTRMGATAHHYRWQIAIKTKGRRVRTTVTGMQWQVGRTGTVTPVMEVAPVSLSGATIRRVTAHHAGNVRQLAIGIGSHVEVIRSGEVIPKLESVLEAKGQVTIPDRCPSCGQLLSWQRDFLKCTNLNCRAQIEQRLHHWFKILGNADWFGIKTIQKIVDAGHDRLEAVYQLGESDFLEMGFGPVQSKNLADAIGTSRTRPVEDWRFLAAFGIADLGTGDSRKLLAHVPIEAVTSLEPQTLATIKGFGEKTSRRIAESIAARSETIDHMLALGFNLLRTPLVDEQPLVDSPIADKRIVFTGKMRRGSRDELQEQARQLGARVQTAVSSKTDFLICGDNVGVTKLGKAAKLGVTVLQETEYLEMISR